MEDTLKFYRTSVNTDDEYRENLVRYLKIGLTRFIGQTSWPEIKYQCPCFKNESALNSQSNKKTSGIFGCLISV